MKKPLLLMLGAAAALGAALSLYPFSRSDPSAQPAAAAVESEAPPSIEAAATPAPASTTRAAAPEPVKAAAPPARPAPQAPPPTAQPKQDPAYQAFIEARFEADEPDPDPQFRIELQRKVFRAISPGSQGEPIQCGKNLCRIRSFHASMGRYQEYLSAGFLHDDPEQRIWTGPLLINEPFHPAGVARGAGVISVIYLARGAAFPSP